MPPKSKAGAACASCCLLSGLLFIVIPLVLFLISAIFGGLLYGVECSEFQLSIANANPALEAASGSVDSKMCSYWEWILYVCGNLVGLATPLTEVSPPSGHIVAKIVDLVIAMWSLSVAGIAIAIIMGLAVLQTATTRINDLIDMLWAGPASKRAGRVNEVAAMVDTAQVRTPERDAPHSTDMNITMRELSEQIKALTAAVGEQQRSLNELKDALSSGLPLIEKNLLKHQQESFDRKKVRRRRSQIGQPAVPDFGHEAEDQTQHTVGDV
jgi:hypothetical protein